MFVGVVFFTSAQETKNNLFSIEDFAFEIYFTNDYPTGTFSEYTTSSIGGGFFTEYTLPLNIFTDVGVCVRIEGASHLINTEVIESMWSGRASLGAWLRFPIWDFYAIQPEISYGLTLFGITGSPDYDGAPDGIYSDQYLQLSVSIRCLVNDFEIDIAPVYTLMLEKENALNAFGFRYGILYRL